MTRIRTIKKNLRGIRDIIPPGYVIGRLTGKGPPILINIKDLLKSAPGGSGAGGGGGGGGDDFSWPPELDNAYSGSANAYKGNLIRPLVSIRISAITAFIQTTTGHTYRAGVFRLDGGDLIDEITGESVTQTHTTALNGAALIFPLTATLATGSDYFVGIGRTDGGDTFVLPLSIESHTVETIWYPTMMLEPYTRSTVLPEANVLIPQQAPALTDAATVTASQISAGIGIRFAIV